VSERLTHAVDRLAACVEAAEADLQRRAAASRPFDFAPEQLVDANGRYLLLDAYTALVGALVAMEGQR